jgi:hypothetical protein
MTLSITLQEISNLISHFVNPGVCTLVISEMLSGKPIYMDGYWQHQSTTYARLVIQQADCDTGYTISFEDPIQAMALN